MTTATTESYRAVDDPINESVKELERTFFFTDVPSCVMRVRPEEEQPQKEVADEDVAAQFSTFCGVLEKTFCFTDLQDINEEDIQRIKSMKSLEEGPPAVEAADTESCSDDSANANDQVSVKKVEGAEESAKRPDSTRKPAPIEHTLPPANSHQASQKKLKNGKPLNALQGSQQAKKDQKKTEKKKSGWGLFRSSKRQQVPASKRQQAPASRRQQAPASSMASI